MAQQKQSIELSISSKMTFRYLLHLPPGYDAASGQPWPLILFLHGLGERGDDLELVKKYGLAKKLETWPDCPFVVVSPQCPAGTHWALLIEALNTLLDVVVEQRAVDQRRIYLTGLSMGGTGAWSLALAHPERFAALAPICGRGIPSVAARLRNLPTWAFHGAKDDVVPVSMSEQMVAALKAAGGDARLTIYPEAGHDSYTAAYDDPALYDWMLSHTSV